MFSLSLCPLDNDPPPQPRFRQPLIQNKKKQVGLENTECNYLVMFFVLGVFILVLSDQIK